MKIKNIVLDFGGILTRLDKARCVKALQQVGAGRIAYYVDECKQEDLFHVLEMGNCTVHEFCEEARRKCSFTDAEGNTELCHTTDEQLIWAWNELIRGVPQEKLDFIKRLHDSGKYKLMMLSNTNEVHWQKAEKEFFTKANGVEGLTPQNFFHHIFLSCDMHVIKPEKEIYERMLEEAGCRAEETIFVDDNKKNCEGANAVGITTIYDPHYDNWMKALEDMLEEDEDFYVATIGNFDGVHAGHRYVIDRLKSIASNSVDETGALLKTMAVTFDVHPRTIFDKNYVPQQLMSLDERVKRLSECGIDKCEVVHFDESFASLTAFEYIKVLHDKYNVRKLLVGYDNHFGRKTEGEGFKDYVRYGIQLGVEVIGCDAYRLPDGTAVSSTLIREYINKGETEKARKLLGDLQ